MTKKCYYFAPRLEKCVAVVTDCHAVEGGFEVATDQTVIYPEGGGQPSGSGTVNDSPVFSAREEHETVWHLTDRAFQKGEEVVLTCNLPERIEHSQQHTGEHIVSGLAKKLFGANNVGFHMARTYATLDLDRPFTDEEVKALENAANKAVFDDLPIEYEMKSREELMDEQEQKPLRKPLAAGVEGEIRVVNIPGVDRCACCGTQVESTAQVGLIKLTCAEHYKGGMRFTFACGMRALTDYQNKQEIVSEIAKRFSTRQDEAYSAVVRQGEELASLKREYRTRTALLMNYLARELYDAADEISGTRLVVSVQEGYSASELKPLSEAVLKQGKCAAMLFVPEGETVRYALAASENVRLSMRDAAEAVNAALGGKGGGRENFAQGSARKRPGFEQTVEQLKGYFSAVLRG